MRGAEHHKYAPGDQEGATAEAEVVGRIPVSTVGISDWARRPRPRWRSGVWPYGPTRQTERFIRDGKNWAKGPAWWWLKRLTLADLECQWNGHKCARVWLTPGPVVSAPILGTGLRGRYQLGHAEFFGPNEFSPPLFFYSFLFIFFCFLSLCFQILNFKCCGEVYYWTKNINSHSIILKLFD
jgi:hypothetical protein